MSAWGLNLLDGILVEWMWLLTKVVDPPEGLPADVGLTTGRWYVEGFLERCDINGLSL